MKSFFTLVKLLFIQQYRIKPTGSNKKRTGTIIALIVLALCFLPMLVGLVIVMYYMGKITGGNVGFCALLMLVCQGLVMLFGLPSIISNVFNCRDADKLLPLPIRSITVFAAKLTVVYVNEVITTAFVILVTLLPFGIGSVAGVGFYLLLLLSLVLIPMLPMLVGCLIAMPFVAITEKLSKNGITKTILQILLFVTVMVLYALVMYFTGTVAGSENSTNMDIASMLIQKLQGLSESMRYIHSNFTLAGAMFATSFGGGILLFLISIAENTLLLALVVLMALGFYKWILRSSLEGTSKARKKVNKKQLEIKNKGVIKELIFTDLKRVTRDSQLGFSSLMGVVLLPAMVVVFYFIFNSAGDNGGSMVEMLKNFSLYQPIASLVILAYMSMLGITANSLGIYPISRENKSFYLIKSLPISFNKYLLSKVILATFVMFICDLLTCVFVVIFFNIMWYWGIAMLLAMSMLGFGSMCLTTLIDLKQPKLGWVNFNRSLKNAKNSWFAMLIGLVSSIALGLIATPFIIWFNNNPMWYVLFIMWVLIIICALVYSIVAYIIMTKKAQSNFEKIEI